MTAPDDPTDLLDEMLERSRQLGFLGPGPVAPQREHARAFLSPLGSAPRVLDLGSGGGVPGLVVAWEMPGAEVVLLDAMAKRCDFLSTAVAELGLDERVHVICGRAEELAREPRWRGTFPVVVARSFGPPAVLAECAVGFLSGPGARVLVSEPPDTAASELRWPDEGLEELALRRGEREQSHGGTVQELVMTGPAPERYPRRVGIPAKRPLF